jgi:hypothetical protein
MLGEIRLEIPSGESAPTLDRLAAEDVLGQLLRREGRMRDLGAEGGDVKLDWVDGVEKALAHPEWLADVEREAADLLRAGIRRVIWAGMGGSVQTVYALVRNGLFDGAPVSVHPLDSTDPASLNQLLAEIARLEGVDLGSSPDRAALRRVLDATAMIGVSMGMTSEEPITHLEWFAGLLADLDVANPSEHIQVMTLPDSYLDRFARPRGSRMVPIQLDAENHTPGRMSAPSTRVFLRPAALRLVADALAADRGASFDGGLLAGVLDRAQSLSRLAHSLADTERADLTRADTFVRLGAYLAASADEGRNKLLVLLPPTLVGFAPWLEQLVEESLGKGGKGLLVFYSQGESALRFGPDVIPLSVRLGGEESADAEALRAAGREVLTLDVPLAPGLGLGETAALCLGFERLVAVFGYLQGITFAGQPAVEAYKRYARELRDAPGPVSFPTDSPDLVDLGSLTLYYQSAIVARLARADLRAEVGRLGGDPADAAGVLAAILSLARSTSRLRYLDLTFNGELTPEARAVLESGRRLLAGEALGIPVKLRTGPSDYHSTEQSETDGPNELVSIRLVALEHEPVLAGSYSDKFLLAQARGTWQAMEDARRWVLMVTFPRLDAAALADLRRLFEGTARLLTDERVPN